MSEKAHKTDALYIPPPSGFFDRVYEKNGWDFGHGDPEIFALRDYLLSINGTVLDLGSGDLRASKFLLVGGLSVTAVDSGAPACQKIEEIRAENSFNIELERKDIFDYLAESDEVFDLVLMAQSLIHANSRSEAVAMVSAAYDHVKPGGQIWVRAVTTTDGCYYPNEHSPNGDPHVHQDYCDCSGELKWEPLLFLEPLDIHLTLAGLGAHITHTQVMPETGRGNVMFGEDLPNIGYRTCGFVTVLATKPFESS